jgi:hypothetical protein
MLGAQWLSKMIGPLKVRATHGTSCYFFWGTGGGGVPGLGGPSHVVSSMYGTLMQFFFFGTGVVEYPGGLRGKGESVVFV